MVTEADVIAEARKWIDTPFHHQGRVLGAGVDCAGVVVGVAHALGLSDYDERNYSVHPDPIRMGQILNAHMIAVSRIIPGSVLWLAYGRDPFHLAIVTYKGFIHASSIVGRVVEVSLDQQWIKRKRGVFLFPGVLYSGFPGAILCN